MMGYDRPSHKYLSFLNKYYGLKDYYPQSNNYVVFDDYFQAMKPSKPKNTFMKSNTVGSGYEAQPKAAAAAPASDPLFNPYATTSSSQIGMQQRRGTGVFSALGSHMMNCKLINILTKIDYRS